MSKFAMASGRLIDIENFTVDNVDLNDIAHSLAKEPRFTNSTPINITYSVGEHSINLYNHVKSGTSTIGKKCALLHDASEFILRDLATPIKSSLKDYIRLEKHVQSVILDRFGLLHDYPYYKTNLKVFDKRILIDEVEAIMPDKLAIYERETKMKKLGCGILYNNHPSTVKQCFLTICKNLGIE